MDKVKSEEDFMCLNWNDLEQSLLIYKDQTSNTNKRSLNIKIVPCNYIGLHGELDIPDNCMADLEQQIMQLPESVTFKYIHN